jgi:hypothetical protein
MYHFSPLTQLTGLHFTYSEFLDKFAVLHNISVSEIGFQSSSLSNEYEKTSTAVVILLVSSKVISNLQDSRLHNCDLDFCRTRVSGLGGIFGDNLRFLIWTQGHGVNGLRDNSNPKELSTAQFKFPVQKVQKRTPQQGS